MNPLTRNAMLVSQDAGYYPSPVELGKWVFGHTLGSSSSSTTPPPPPPGPSLGTVVIVAIVAIAALFAYVAVKTGSPQRAFDILAGERKHQREQSARLTEKLL